MGWDIMYLIADVLYVGMLLFVVYAVGLTVYAVIDTVRRRR